MPSDSGNAILSRDSASAFQDAAVVPNHDGDALSRSQQTAEKGGAGSSETSVRDSNSLDMTYLRGIRFWASSAL